MRHSPNSSRHQRLNTPVLSIQGLSVAFGKRAVLTDINFEVHAGERIGLIGPNGAGKTTLVNALTGLVPSSGSLTMNGTSVVGLKPFERARLGMARSFQSPQAVPELTVFDNCLLAVCGGRFLPSWRPFSKAGVADDRIVAAGKLLRIAALDNDGLTPVHTLSYGQRRRLDLAIGIGLDPQILMLDEPSAGLSESDQQEVRTAIDDLSSSVPILIIDHDLDSVAEICTRAVVLHQGRIIADGDPREVLQDTQVLSAYWGTDA